MKHLASSIAVVLCISMSAMSPAWADDGTNAAKEHFKNGTLAYDLGHYAHATTWALLDETADRLTTLAVDPTAPAKLLAAPALAGGIFRSVDGGANWSNVAASPTQASVPWLAFLNSAASAYALSTANEILGSSDAGASWTQLGNVPNVAPTTLAVSPVDLKSVFLGTTGAGVYVTRSGGK